MTARFPGPTFSFLRRAATCVLICIQSGCTTGSNSLEVREREAALIPPALYEIAPSVAASLSPIEIRPEKDQLAFYGENGCTGTILPDKLLLSAAHGFRKHLQRANHPIPKRSFTVADPNGGDPVQLAFTAVLYPMLINDQPRFASLVGFEPAETRNGDWALFSLDAPGATKVAAGPTPAISSIRFDGAKFIPRGTPLYCIGFPLTPGTDPGVTGFPRSLTIVQGVAPKDLSAVDEIEAKTDSEIDMRGMSGGPVGTYDFSTGEFTVVGIATHGSMGFKFFGSPLIQPFFSASRIPEIALPRPGIQPAPNAMTEPRAE